VGQPLATLAIISHERPILRDRAIESGLHSIARSGYAVPVLLIDSSRIPRSAPAGVRLVHRPDKPMCVSKRRMAAELSDTEWVVLLDDDCQAVPEAIGTLLAAMESDDHRRTAALFVVTQFSGPQTRMFRAASRSDLTAGFGQSADGDISWGVTTLAAFRRRALLSVDAFNSEDLAVRVGGEDVDACIRLRTAGWRVRQLPEVLALHDTATWDSFAQNVRRSRNYGAAEAQLVRLHPGHARIGYENLLVSMVFGALCARLAGPRVKVGLLAGLVGWLVSELLERRAEHQEATSAEIGVQALWSASYELGRLRTATVRRDPRLAVWRFNWEVSEPTGFSPALSRRTAKRLAVTGLAAMATAAMVKHRGSGSR
jgi:hypothetical protein